MKNVFELDLNFLYSQNVRKVTKKQNFSPKQYFVVLFEVSAWLFNNAVRKIGLIPRMGVLMTGLGPPVGRGESSEAGV
jgi:hypothetical protein